MRKLALTLAARLVLRQPISTPEIDDNWEVALRKFAILEATELTEEERKAVEAASTITIACPECGKSISSPSNITRLDELTDKPKEVLLEDTVFEWLEEFKKTHTPWPPNQAFYDLHEAIKGAVRVKPGKGEK